MDCAECNGVLAKAMMERMTRDEIAHAYVHESSRSQQLEALLWEVLRAGNANTRALNRAIHKASPSWLGRARALLSGQRFVVECEVWGGVTGHRKGFLRRNGEVIRFATLEDAQREAAAASERTKASPTARFSYRAAEEP